MNVIVRRMKLLMGFVETFVRRWEFEIEMTVMD
jgi:hypothetical protein